MRTTMKQTRSLPSTSVGSEQRKKMYLEEKKGLFSDVVNGGVLDMFAVVTTRINQPFELTLL